MAKQFKKVLVTGGAGYVGSRLVPKLLSEGYKVNVLDLYMYGKNIFGSHQNDSNLLEVCGDIRNQDTIKKAIEGCDAVIHLACISNDPSFDLDPQLGKSINYDAFLPLVRIAKEANIRRFIYASSSSVYGVKKEKNVTEELSLEPLTDYSKYKADCEKILFNEMEDDFEAMVVRPATVCGYSARLRLDLTVNILTMHAYYNKKIKVFGGEQLRPNIHIDDMANAYLSCLAADKEDIMGQIFNVGYQNLPVAEIAELVRQELNANIPIEVVPSDDNRSYHVSSEKIKKVLNFIPKHTIENAIYDLKNAFDHQWVHDPLINPNYYNIKKMQQLEFK
jgi:nucleoside-diphosphate-sugar epimerase